MRDPHEIPVKFIPILAPGRQVPLVSMRSVLYSDPWGRRELKSTRPSSMIHGQVLAAARSGSPAEYSYERIVKVY